MMKMCDSICGRVIGGGLLTVLLAAMIGLSPLRAAGGGDKSGELFVLATLYTRHKNVAIYDLLALRKIILAIAPEVLVLDVTPSELKEWKVWPGKVEYTEVVFPLVREGQYRLYPAEPAEPMFSEIVNATSEALGKFKAANPDAAVALKQFEIGAYEALKVSWQTPADVNSQITDRVLLGKTTLELRLMGSVREDGHRRWNEHTVEVTRRAVQENPGKRVLVLAGIENCYSIREALGRDPKLQLINMEQWLRNRAKTGAF
jgi:hypothetical protein